MLASHLPLLLTGVIAAALGGLILVLGTFLGPRRPNAVKDEVFETGNPPSGDARERFNVKYFLVAMLFLVFDIEAVFIYPWAVVFSDAARGGPIAEKVPALLALLEMVIFVAVVLVGLAYAWRKGALEWGPQAHFEAEKPAGHGSH